MLNLAAVCAVYRHLAIDGDTTTMRRLAEAWRNLSASPTGHGNAAGLVEPGGVALATERQKRRRGHSAPAGLRDGERGNAARLSGPDGAALTPQGDQSM
jgi:hypothetical protein